MKNLDNTLNERKSSNGSFITSAEITQSIKSVLHNSSNWESLSAPHKQALDMIALKMARAVNGDPNNPDHWHDIQGYARLAEESIEPNCSK